MFRYGWIAVLMCGCAVGSVDQDNIVLDNVIVADQADSGAEDLRAADDLCTPIPNGPICQFYYSRNPYPYYGPLDQYSINCEREQYRNWDWKDCFDFSYDGLVYSDPTWAICCPHKNAPVIK